MIIDPTAFQSLITAIGAVLAAAVGLWNAFQAAKLKRQVDETNSELKALRFDAAAKRVRRAK